MANDIKTTCLKSIMIRMAAIWIMACLLAAPSACLAAQVGIIHIKGPIGPATASYIKRALEVSNQRNDVCLIIVLDTPGGLLESTKDIVQSFYSSPVPTVVYVWPEAATAGSAGVFIAMAANIAAMAPHSSIGAAHPVALGGLGGGEEKSDDVMKKKMESYAISFIESIADKRNRNVAWAKSAVLDSAAITAEKALELKVIDFIAGDLTELLQKINGFKIGERALVTANAKTVEIPMSARENVFQLIWRPEVMFALMLIVIYGIIGELSSPGAILPGVAGVISLIILLYMSSVLPINIAGLALIGLAVALFIIDVFAPTHGVLTGGGILAFFLGSLMLFDGAAPGFKLSLAYIIAATVITTAFFVFIVGAGLRAQFRPALTGKETMIGQTANTVSAVDAQGGKVFIEGELWNAVSSVDIPQGHPVEIVGIEGLTLKVKPTVK